MTTLAQSTIAFSGGGPFYPMVATFIASAVGLGPLFNPTNPLGLDATQRAVFRGFVSPVSEIDMQQVIRQTLGGGITADAALNSLCAMLANAAYEQVGARNDGSPEFEAFRHLRNAASHSNRFFFKPREPKLPAAWRTLRIDESLKGAANPLQGTQCFGTVIGPADILQLLSDIEPKVT